MQRFAIAGAVALSLAVGQQTQGPPQPRGVRLADLSWVQAEPLLDAAAIVVVPLGAGAAEHGPHLKLNVDQRLANYLTSRVLAAAQVVVAPALTYHFYPAFADYPGSTSLTLATARSLTVESVRSIAGSGPRRFYVLNTSLSTVQPLQQAAEALAPEGILLQFTDVDAKLSPVARQIQQQPGGTHADEIETSMMLYIDAASVDMTKAVRDYNPPPTAGPFNRRRGARGTYSPTGAFGDPTLATPEKGRQLVEALVAGILNDLQRLRSTPLPSAMAVVARPQPGAPSAASRSGSDAPDCSPGDERAIRNIGVAFTSAWANNDAERIAGLWVKDGDIRHPDGTIERGAQIIRENRTQLFMQRAYQGTKHPVTLYDVRCVGRDVAIADGKWELRGLTDAKGAQTTYAGLVTIVARRSGPESQWSIEAWRYTINPPPNAPPPPTVLKKPGWPGGN